MSEQGVVAKKRGWGLTILIPLSIIGAILSAGTIALDLLADGDVYPSSPTWQLLFFLINQLLVVVFFIAAWQWQRCGCFGLIVLTAVSAVVGLLAGTPATYLLAPIIGIVFLFAVYKSKEGYFE